MRTSLMENVLTTLRQLTNQTSWILVILSTLTGKILVTTQFTTPLMIYDLIVTLLTLYLYRRHILQTGQRMMDSRGPMVIALIWWIDLLFFLKFLRAPEDDRVVVKRNKPLMFLKVYLVIGTFVAISTTLLYLVIFLLLSPLGVALTLWWITAHYFYDLVQ